VILDVAENGVVPLVYDVTPRSHESRHVGLREKSSLGALPQCAATVRAVTPPGPRYWAAQQIEACLCGWSLGKTFG
jgi:hypothetical protein